MANILVVKVNAFLHGEDMDNLIKYIHKSMETGLVILPPYCDTQIVPDNVEVRIENQFYSKGGTM